MRIEGQARSGGPIITRDQASMPIPTTPLSRPGSDIVSRMAALEARVSPIGASPEGEHAYVERTTSRKYRGSSARFDRVEIAARYRRGASAPRIAKDLGCSTATVYTALKEHGVKIRQGRPRKSGGTR
jgi:hypothetical protein